VANHIRECNVLVVVGTSLEVSPANEIVNLIDDDCQLIVIDPNPNRTFLKKPNFTFIEKSATVGILEFTELI
jgi:NAD-dependent deacetylase